MGSEDKSGASTGASSPASPRRELKEREARFRQELAALGIDRIRMMYERATPKADPLKFLWMEHWLAEQVQKTRAAETERMGRSEATTRRIAIGALIVAAISAGAAIGSWLFPRK